MENRIITINNTDEYFVLKEKTIDGKKYVFCSKYNETDESISENDFVVLEVTLNGDNLQLLDIEDNTIAERVTRMFLEEMKNM